MKLKNIIEARMFDDGLNTRGPCVEIQIMYNVPSRGDSGLRTYTNCWLELKYLVSEPENIRSIACDPTVLFRLFLGIF